MLDATRRKIGVGLVLAGLLGTIGLVPLGASPTPRRDDPEDVEERLAEGRQLVRNQCLVCHGEEIIASQRLTPAQWEAEVKKMVGWGAVVPSDRASALSAHLAGQYPADGPPASVASATPAEVASEAVEPASVPVAGDARRGAAVFASQCANCHGPSAAGGDLGPNLVEKPVLYRPATWAAVLRDGRNAMPGFASALKPGEQDDLLSWLRGRRWPDDGR